MNRNIFISFFILLLATSCATLKKPVMQPDQLALTKENVKVVEGIYKIEQMELNDTAQDYINNLSWILLVYGKNETGDQVRLAWEEPNRLRVDLLKEGRSIDRNVFKGKVKDGYLVLRRRIKLYPFVLVNLYRNRNIRLGMLTSGDLVVDSKTFTFFNFMIVIPGVEVEKIYGAKFWKVQELTIDSTSTD